MHPRDLIIEAELAGQIRAALAEHADEDLTIDMVEGETHLFELLDRIMDEDAEDDARIEAIKTRQSDLRERKARLERRQKVRRSVVQAALDTAGIRKLERAEYTASLRAVPAGVEIVDLDAIPDDLVRLKREADKTAIKKALGDGPVAGARLTNGGETVSIRRK